MSLYINIYIFICKYVHNYKIEGDINSYINIKIFFSRGQTVMRSCDAVRGQIWFN